MSKSK